MSRPLTATIDLAALRHNCQLARRLHGGKVLAAVKANAYGHGAIQCANALAGFVDAFGVAAIEEAIALRAAGIQTPILLLEGWFELPELKLIQQLGLWTVVHSEAQVAQLEQVSLAHKLAVWLKVDSGMHRLGIPPQSVRQLYARLMAIGKVNVMVAMTHFARADESGAAATSEQASRFLNAIEGLPVQTSMSNSGGIQAWPFARGDWCRPGILLYGGRASDMQTAEQPRTVMNLDSRIIALRHLAAGEPIGYGAQFVTDGPTRMGVVACGYADGYPRSAPSDSPVLVCGRKSRILGRVSMDMLAVDLTDIPEAGLGAPVRLWGEGLTATEVATAAGTIDYELFCNVKRAHFIYR